MTEWKLVKIGEVCRIEKGATGIASATPGDYPLVVTALERKTCSTYQFDCEAVCIPLVSSSGHGKKSLKYVHYQNGKFALGTILAAVIPNDKNELSARYLHQYLQFYKDTLIVPLMHGAANVSLAIRDIEQIEIPLPPIEKQNEFAKLFVRMQENDVELQSEFETQKDLIKKLRQSILQDAIEGKLTEDWRKENPLKKGDINFDAEALFEKIQDEKNKQEKGSKKKKDNGKLQVIGEEKPFGIPESWKSVSFGSIININGGYSFKSEKYTENGVRVIRISDFNENGFVNLNKVYYLDSKDLNAYRLEKNNILMAMTGGTVGKTLLVSKLDEPMVVNQRVATIKIIKVHPKFADYFLKSKYSQKLINDKKHSTNDNISLPDITNLIFPFPPLAEQNEIVRRAEKQLAKVEQLEQQVQERENLTKSLFRGILKNAFEKK